MSSMRTILVLLNYNNYSDTISFVKRMKRYDELYRIIIVDNASVNNSFSVLKSSLSNVKKVDVVESEVNGGYARGNNYGIKYALSRYEFQNIIIANPDVSISGDSLLDLIKRKEKLDELNGCRTGIVAPTMINKSNGRKSSGWKLPRYVDDVRSNLMIISKLFKNPLHEDHTDTLLKNTKSIDVVSGAFFLIDKDAMVDVDFFDERTFLYCEERILSFKLKKEGYLNFVFSDCFFYHQSSTTIRASINEINAFKELNKSKKIYHKYYLKTSSLQDKIFQLTAFIGILERKVYFYLKAIG
ncbi:glycosyltransferase [Lactiplantibacillus plantarum]|uniref:glycosyltransferase n=1 Tax=Lactiplantibacillus plantarum TaxID=1590 RepID=UPI002652E25B|nr:glycosyltransferase family 2 protein [Lactiplantibacillus plantarum]MDN7016959.1 glycosyltransferase family 2 protein [Lactiplantibacillus plantarum]MDN7050965.1 glycosyltransferase family 2 protein [Lactiplantibacillus plantarum]MDN7053979.1 glycosyltransferase family 2 protein [Lactiplantibacillus plantarum]MDN7057052.1 glycosyltransferase family 2 protein [Lactiplantibacillus plantarum]MDN7060061.1 glycosyltransferase family 2 protein [Lactiplantibacillus plantarum]